ncbi:MAG: hypothetical protein JWQ40_396 [Segetibacter sp.]|nr:hypothetical protein [Segetibacter sp.]
MKQLFCAGLLFLATACGPGENTNNISESDTTIGGPGNSGGSDIIAMDTARMDTGSSGISTDKIK